MNIKDHIIRLRYEILGTSIKELSLEFGLPEEILEDQRHRERWTQVYAPSIDQGVPEDGSAPGVPQASLDPTEDIQKRLRLFKTAVEVLLVGQLAHVEAQLLTRVYDILEDEDNTAFTLKDAGLVGTLLRDLHATKGSRDQTVSGLPLVITKDLTGRVSFHREADMEALNQDSGF